MPKYSRRKVILGTGAALIAGASTVAATTIDEDDASVAWQLRPEAAEPDPEQRFVRLATGGDGVIFGVQSDGSLTWMRHLDWRTGGKNWANNGVPLVIGEDWLRFRWVLAAQDGQVFGITSDGEVTWHRYDLADPATGAGKWAERSGTVVAEGLGHYQHVFGGHDTMIYGVDADSRLWWHQYQPNDGSTGTAAWANAARPVAVGDALTGRSFAGPGGVIYDIYDNQIAWRRHSVRSGVSTWYHEGKPQLLGAGWEDYRWVMAAADGVIYCVDNARGQVPVRADRLLWRKHSDPLERRVRWAGEDRGVIGTGFTIEPLAALQGYATRLSVRPGEQLPLAVSTGHKEYQVSVLRLVGKGDATEQILTEPTVVGGIQHLPPDYRSHGCRWEVTHRVSVPQDWRSGLYAVRLEAPGGWRFDIPFVVRPVKPQAKLAYLWPTNTYNAYNEWGGHSQYTSGQKGAVRTCTFMRPSIFNNVDGPPERRISSDLILLRWMEHERIVFDSYHDGDLHESGDWLNGYKALVLGVHPEYWSEVMRSRLLQYLKQGGRLIYVGGNGLYERVKFGPDGQSLSFRTSAGERDLYSIAGKPESEVLGVAYHSPSYGSRAPYRVVRDHPLLKGTGLRPGSTFGHNGALGAASGWEMDRRATQDEYVIAEGQNPYGGAHMVFIPHAGGGWVFSAGSITFTGSLPYDPSIRRLLRNVFDMVPDK